MVFGWEGGLQPGQASSSSQDKKQYMYLGIFFSHRGRTSKATGCDAVHLRSCKLALQNSSSKLKHQSCICVSERAQIFETKNTRPISPRCRHSATVSLRTLSCTSGPLWSVTPDPPNPWPFQACHSQQMDMYPEGIREPMMHGKAIQWGFS